MHVQLIIGDRLPEATVKTTIGEIRLPYDYQGKWLLLFSHPADFTPVCTTEFISFQKNIETFESMQCHLIGLSVDQAQSHLKWIEWMKQHTGVDITFPVIADPLGHVAKRFGMIRNDNHTTTVRTVFIVNPKGKIRAILNYPMEVGRNIAEIIRILEALQIAEKQKVAMPANWPNNELIFDRVLLPPPGTTHGIQKRMTDYLEGNIEYLDWWFCHRALSNPIDQTP